jgi:hypothetical protein
MPAHFLDPKERGEPPHGTVREILASVVDVAGPRLSPFPEAAAAEGRVAIAAVGAAPGVEGRGRVLPHLEGALRFAAHDDHKIGILASLNAKALV